MNVVVITQNQMSSIVPMWSKVRRFNYVFVLDRCTDMSEHLCKKFHINYIKTPSTWMGRMTSSARNFGYKWFKDRGELDDTLFLDGDRVPVKGDLSSLSESKTDITLLRLQQDFRDNRSVPYEEIWGDVYNDFFSCGIFFRSHALTSIESFYRTNTDAYQDSLIFPENIQQFWGIEDTHLGDICYHLGLTCTDDTDIRLRGTFEKSLVDSLDVIEARFKLRDKLNVKW